MTIEPSGSEGVDHRLIELVRRGLHLAELGHRTSMRETLLEAWRIEPHATIGRRLLEEPWLDLEKSAAKLERLRDVDPLLRAVRGNGRDPRATGLMLCVARLDLSAAPVTLDQLGEAFLRTADPLAKSQLLAVAAAKTGREATALGAVARQLPDAPTVARELAPLLDRLGGLLPLQSALEAVYSNPESGEARGVFADWLVERSDPWGELINIQIAGVSNPREDELITELTPRLCEGLRPASVQVLRVRSGFPEKVALDTEQGSMLGASAAWRTVRELTVRPFGHSIESLISDPMLRNLEVLLGARDTCFSKVGQLSRLRRLGLVYAQRYGPNPGVSSLEQLQSLLLRLPALTRLELDAGFGDEHITEWSKTTASQRVTLAVLRGAWSLEWVPNERVRFEIRTGDTAPVITLLEQIARRQSSLKVEVRIRRTLNLAASPALLRAVAGFAHAQITET